MPRETESVIHRRLQPAVKHWAPERFVQLEQIGKTILRGSRNDPSGLIDSSLPVSDRDLIRIHLFHEYGSPTENDWNLYHPKTFNVASGQYQDAVIPRNGVTDGSTYANWESPGGPLEHINLAMNAGLRITDIVKQHLKSDDEITEDWVREAVAGLKETEGNFIAAAMGLHDEGREVTHTYLVNDIVGGQLLNKIGIRKDLQAIMPAEEVMLTPKEKSMDEVIRDLDPRAVLVRLADEFGKRAPKTNRLYQPEDYDAWDRDAWAKGYKGRPLTGIQKDKWMRGQMQLHVDNVPRYFGALDRWVRSVSNLTLKDITMQLNEELSPLLDPNY